TLTEKDGQAKGRRGIFRMRAGKAETLMVESLGVGGARDLSFGTLQDTLDRQSVNGTTAFADIRDGLWVVWRSRPIKNSRGDITSFKTEPIAQEVGSKGQRRSDVSGDPPRFILDAGPLLQAEGLPTAAGPVFTLDEAGGVAFLASDGKRWGI